MEETKTLRPSVLHRIITYIECVLSIVALLRTAAIHIMFASSLFNKLFGIDVYLFILYFSFCMTVFFPIIALIMLITSIVMTVKKSPKEKKMYIAINIVCIIPLLISIASVITVLT